MALPEPESLVRGLSNTPKCCRDPELKAWLDELKALREAGKDVGSADAIANTARANGYAIGSSTIRAHFRGECEPS
jgi:hypothetical protein